MALNTALTSIWPKCAAKRSAGNLNNSAQQARKTNGLFFAADSGKPGPDSRHAVAITLLAVDMILPELGRDGVFK
jgi:hypothetical protein